MLRFLFYLVAPEEKLPPGATQVSLGYEGLSWGWGFFAFVILAAIVICTYHAFAPHISRFSRIGLTILRSILFGLLLLLLVRPILQITVQDATRWPLLVLLDTTQSMGLVDHRNDIDDLTRAALAAGVLDPAGGLKQSLNRVPVDDLKQISRQQLLEKLAGNSWLNLWPRLYANTDVAVYGFGRKLTELGNLAPPEKRKLTVDDSAAFIHSVQYDNDITALGDGLRDLLDQQRGQPTSGIFLITDGGNNSGSNPLEAAALAKQDAVPLFIYGIGVTSPQDILVSELNGPQVSNVKEKLEMTVHFRAQGMIGKTAKIQLKANGKIVDEEPIEFRADGDQEMKLSYTPTDEGEVDLEAFVPPLPEEAVKENNSAVARVRIIDDKIKVLLVEQEPNWDYRYLLDMLQRDRRVRLRCVMLKEDGTLTSGQDSPFLDRIPDTKEALFTNDLVIIGDVDPNELGGIRMQLLTDLVNKMGGGLIFLAGPKYNPRAYQGTPLEPLLPVTITTRPGERYHDPVQLRLTATGESSNLLMLSQDPQENSAIWAGFPGVKWTALVGKARPGAQVLLTDPTPDRALENGPMPVMALQSYGAGKSLFVGFDESYRWRSHVGEKYYTQIWSRLLQALSERHVLGASALTQLKTDRSRYHTGDRIRISGHIYKEGFEPLTDARVPGILSVTPQAQSDQPTPAPQQSDLHLQAIPDRPGEYQGSITGLIPGNYSFSTKRDPSVAIKFEVRDPKMELADIAMNEKLLRDMAGASGGRFLREEDLNGLPDLVIGKSADSVTFKKIPLAYTPLLLAFIISIACIEWLWRRKLELK